MPAVVSISGLSKTYASGFQALKGIDLAIRRGEIFDRPEMETTADIARG